MNKIRVAVKASKEVSEGQFIVCARTDARGVHGIEETVKRAKLYIDAGADMIFPEGLTSLEEFRLVSSELRKHNKDILLLANMTEFGKTPYINVVDFKAVGYNCVIYPVSTLRIASRAIDDFLTELKDTGSQETELGNMQTRKELYSSLQYEPGKEWFFPTPINKDTNK